MSSPEIKGNNSPANNARPSPPSALESADYDPHLHRDMTKATSNFVTFINLLKAIIGTGIFAMPNALSKSGYVVGIFGGIVIGTLLTHCIHSVVQCQYILCKRHRLPVLNYPMTMKLALEDGPRIFRRMAPYSKSIVDVFVLIMTIGIASVYVIFTAQNLALVTNVPKDVDWVRIFILILLIPLIGLALIRNLKLLAPFSTFATGVTVAGIGIILYFLLQDMQPISKMEPVGTVDGFVFFLGTTLFALVVMSIVLPLENNMKTPKSFVSGFGVVNLVMALTTGLYMVFGFFGYWKYNDRIEDLITKNLPTKSTSDVIVTKLIQIMFALSVFLSSSIYMYVATEIIWNRLSKYFTNQFLGETIVRVSLAVFVFSIAIAYQDVGQIISLIGSLCLSMLAIGFPAIIKICVTYPHFGRCQYILIWNSFLIIVGIIVMVAGIVNSVNEIINSIKNK